KVDLREQGTIIVSCDGQFPMGSELLSAERLRSLEPELNLQDDAGRATTPAASLENGFAYIPERSVDPRKLVAAALKAARHREVDISSGTEVQSLLVQASHVTGVQTDKGKYSAPIVVNCAGSWAGTIPPQEFP